MSIRSTSLVGLIAVVCFTGTAFGQTDDNALVRPLQTKTDRFFAQVENNAIKDAFTELLQGSPVAEQEEAIDALAKKAGEITDLYGRRLGSSMIQAKVVDEDLVLLRYLDKCENYPIVWTFWFYHPPSGADSSGSGWYVVTVRFDNDLRMLETGE